MAEELFTSYDLQDVMWRIDQVKNVQEISEQFKHLDGFPLVLRLALDRPFDQSFLSRNDDIFHAITVPYINNDQTIVAVRRGPRSFWNQRFLVNW